ncbi:MAG: hypothetical protein MHM6MM_002650 [Cercozoa sp. M6MM]
MHTFVGLLASLLATVFADASDTVQTNAKDHLRQEDAVLLGVRDVELHSEAPHIVFALLSDAILATMRGGHDFAWTVAATSNDPACVPLLEFDTGLKDEAHKALKVRSASEVNARASGLVDMPVVDIDGEKGILFQVHTKPSKCDAFLSVTFENVDSLRPNVINTLPDILGDQTRFFRVHLLPVDGGVADEEQKQKLRKLTVCASGTSLGSDPSAQLSLEAPPLSHTQAEPCATLEVPNEETNVFVSVRAAPDADDNYAILARTDDHHVHVMPNVPVDNLIASKEHPFTLQVPLSDAQADVETLVTLTPRSGQPVLQVHADTHTQGDVRVTLPSDRVAQVLSHYHEDHPPQARLVFAVMCPHRCTFALTWHASITRHGSGSDEKLSLSGRHKQLVNTINTLPLDRSIQSHLEPNSAIHFRVSTDKPVTVELHKVEAQWLTVLDGIVDIRQGATATHLRTQLPMHVLPRLSDDICTVVNLGDTEAQFMIHASTVKGDQDGKVLQPGVRHVAGGTVLDKWVVAEHENDVPDVNASGSQSHRGDKHHAHDDEHEDHAMQLRKGAKMRFSEKGDTLFRLPLDAASESYCWLQLDATEKVRFSVAMVRRLSMLGQSIRMMTKPQELGVGKKFRVDIDDLDRVNADSLVELVGLAEILHDETVVAFEGGFRQTHSTLHLNEERVDRVAYGRLRLFEMAPSVQESQAAAFIFDIALRPLTEHTTRRGALVLKLVGADSETMAKFEHSETSPDEAQDDEDSDIDESDDDDTDDIEEIEEEILPAGMVGYTETLTESRPFVSIVVSLDDLPCARAAGKRCHFKMLVMGALHAAPTLFSVQVESSKSIAGVDAKVRQFEGRQLTGQHKISTEDLLKHGLEREAWFDLPLVYMAACILTAAWHARRKKPRPRQRAFNMLADEQQGLLLDPERTDDSIADDMRGGNFDDTIIFPVDSALMSRSRSASHD